MGQLAGSRRCDAAPWSPLMVRGTMTSSTSGADRRNPCSHAAVRCDSTADGFSRMTSDNFASQIVRGVEYRPRPMRTSQLARSAALIVRSVHPSASSSARVAPHIGNGK